MGEPSHKAPWRSLELTSYFEGLMDGYAKYGSRHLIFTPPTTRGALITRCEAWAINTQRDYVPTLADTGNWPIVSIGVHPDTMSSDQERWLSRFWGDAARKWVEAGCPGSIAPIDIVEHKRLSEKKKYADLVLQKFNEFERADKRNFLERKSAVERSARYRL